MSNASQPPWEFWIDVGGTFTDCFARRPDGSLLRHKLLSTGVVQGAVGAGSDRRRIVDPGRASDPPRCWLGCRLTLMDAAGNRLAAGQVTAFEAEGGVLSLAEPLGVDPAVGQVYELSTGEPAPLAAMRYLLCLSVGDPLPSASVRLGTTRGTNALLTRRGAKTALATTRGLGDVLRIGYQSRPRLFELGIEKPEPLFVEGIEIDERLAADGAVLVTLKPEVVRRQLKELKQRGVESLAICLLHACENPEHERAVEEIAREVGYEEISVSSRVSPLVKIVARGDTTVVDAYLNPVLRNYVRTLRAALGDSTLRLMTSAGGLITAEQFTGKDSILSGPAGGVVGFAQAAKTAGFERAIGFDMGGTSTDVSRYDGRYELEFETEKAGVRLSAPMMAIETVAAGGGSICHFDGVKLVVGPDSAGADPGPACYGRGGPLAVTDVNFMLGKIPAARFPFPLDRAAVETRLGELARQVREATGVDYSPVELADGFLRVANANMVKAIRSVSIAKGCDPREYVLVAFGGAAGQHACAIARELGMREILIHPDAGVLSALGIGRALLTRHGVAGVYRAYLPAAVRELEKTFDELAAEAAAGLRAEGVAAERIETRRALDLRYAGLDAFLSIPRPADGDYGAAYTAEHRRIYGYVHENRGLEIVAARLEAVARGDAEIPASRRASRRSTSSRRGATAYFDARACDAQLFDRDELQPGEVIEGPAIIAEKSGTTVVDPGWSAEVMTGGELLLTDQGKALAAPLGQEADPVMLEIFNRQFAGVAEQMGITLRNTASSVNVKERLDFSCAVFTSQGDLVVNAPHIPVHLGAMSETVRRIILDNPRIEPGDVFVTNDPYRGGSHLPDVTVVTPVHDDRSGRLVFFTGSRAHHAEIGGTAPGSMPPFSTNLAEEGVLIRNFKLIAAGRSRFDALRDLLTSGPYPTRAVEDNLADIAAQVAANQYGVRELNALVERCTLPVVVAYMGHIQQAAERKMRAALARLTPGRRTFVDHLDDGSSIAVSITVAGDAATIDFTGTGPVLPGNLNANRAIVTAAVMYCLRCLIDEEIPLNQGVLAPITIMLPECLLNPPEQDDPARSAAIAGGNVETSQRVVDVLLGALGAAAASQGTMNNVLFGDAKFGYYETICGGAGATADRNGADAVHTHMTNTRLTDPEVMERRYPVRLREFSIRRGSGGAGLRRGGDGVVRRIEFLRPLEVSILSQRRGPHAPYGLHGGRPGALGRNLLRRRDGVEEQLPALATFQAEAGDVLLIETPGGGGYGAL